MNWNDLRFFLAVARHGGLTGVAREMRASPSTVAAGRDPGSGAAKPCGVAGGGPCPAQDLRHPRHDGVARRRARPGVEGDLFAVETTIRGRSPAERQRARAERSTPILDALKAHLEATLASVSGKSPLAKAIRYATSRWPALTRFIADGRLEPSNNAAERAIRPLTLGRRDYLFATSDAGGRRTAVFYTLITTARLNGVDPKAWLTDVIGRIADHP